MRTMAVNFPKTSTISFKAGPRCDCRYFYKVVDIVLNLRTLKALPKLVLLSGSMYLQKLVFECKTLSKNPAFFRSDKSKKKR